MPSVEIRLFGALRRYQRPNDPLRVDLTPGMSIDEARALIGAALVARDPAFSDQPLLAAAALADEAQVFAADAVLPAGLAHLALLPPVNGG